MRKSLNPALIASSNWGTLLVGLVIVRAIIIMVPFLVSFVLDTVSFLAPIFYPVTGISVAENIMQVSIFPVSVMLHRGSDATG
jgi:hypothetical protein